MHCIQSFETSVSIYPSTGRNIPRDFKVSLEVPVGRMAILKQVVREVTYRSSHTLLCLFSGISSIVRFYIISFFYFFPVFTHPTFHLLVVWLLETLQGPQRKLHPMLPFQLTKAAKRIFIPFSFPFVSLCSPSISVLSLVISKRIFTP